MPECVFFVNVSTSHKTMYYLRCVLIVRRECVAILDVYKAVEYIDGDLSSTNKTLGTG